ncbi:MAG: metallophosphoesterase family protein [Syntrophaceae bacterium]|nr:metallophosphoesterase family protein [Syntrophaceae bacterium]
MRIGILSDSHGNEEATQRAVEALLEQGAVCLIHLGDLCESMEGRLTGTLLALARRHELTVIKGNNDLAVERLLDENPSRNEEEETARAFLKHLPLRVAVDDLLFAHSMPDGTVRSVYDPIDDGGTEKAAEVFARTSFTALFCGHSHSPVLFRLRRGKVIREPVPSAEDLPLLAEERYIIIAGAVTEGECALMDTERRTYRRIPL